jgi:tRNA G37 N-methylase Trm5
MNAKEEAAFRADQLYRARVAPLVQRSGQVLLAMLNERDNIDKARHEREWLQIQAQIREVEKQTGVRKVARPTHYMPLYGDPRGFVR